MVEKELKEIRGKLIFEIETAFADVSIGSGVTLHQAITIDDHGSLAEQQKARKLDNYQSWRDISDKDILDCCSALSFFDPQGFLFHLPAFMRLAIQTFPDDPNGIRSSCEFHLTQEHGLSLRKSEPGRIASRYAFSPSQVKAIAKFLRFVSDFDLKATSFIESVVKWENLAKAV